MKYALLLLAGFAPALSFAAEGFAPAPAGVAQSAAPWFQKTHLFHSGANGYELCRIPGLVITPRGTIIVHCDERRTIRYGDWGNIDIAMRRSTDRGATWSPITLFTDFARLDAQGYTFTQNPVAIDQHLSVPGKIFFNNQMLVVDRVTGSVILLFCTNYNRVFVEQSDDDGATYGHLQEITAVVEGYRPEYPWRVIATGPNHGIQLSNGRLLAPIWMSKSGGPNGCLPAAVGSIYSDDHGRTWHRGAVVAQDPLPIRDPNETVAVELANGGVLFDMRTQAWQNRRAVSYSPDGATDWSPAELIDDLADPHCMAGLDRLSSAAHGGTARLVTTFCDNVTDSVRTGNPWPALKRKNLTVAISYDEGRRWPVRRVIEPGWSGYSDVTVDPDGLIYCFYEEGSIDGTGRANQTQDLTLARFNLAWVSRGREHLLAERASVSQRPLRDGLQMVLAAADPGQVEPRQREMRVLIAPAAAA